jgi:hypothetical protein
MKIMLILFTMTPLLIPDLYGASEDAALILEVKGRVVISHNQQHNVARAFEWVQKGSDVESGEGSSMTLLHQTGKKIEIGPRSKAIVESNDVRRVRGNVSVVGSMPRLPKMPPAVSAEVNTSRPAAVRVRSQALKLFRPVNGSYLLHEDVVLRFEPAAGAARYGVTIANEAGTTVLDIETDETSVKVPNGVIEPGQRYVWNVRTVDAVTGTYRGEAEFQTLDSEQAAARRDFMDRLNQDDWKSLAVMASIDARLGLTEYAQRAIEKAMPKAPDEAARDTLRELARTILPPPVRHGAQLPRQGSRRRVRIGRDAREEISVLSAGPA